MVDHVFLSYVRENTAAIDRLARELEARGVPVWLDRERLLPGQRWRDVIRSAIRAGDLFIACFSKEYLARDRSYMNEELTLAIDELRQRPTNRSWFIPVSLDGTEIPARNIGGGETIQDLQWVNLAIGWERGVALIAQAVSAYDINDARNREGGDGEAPDEEDAGLLDAGDAFMARMGIRRCALTNDCRRPQLL